MYDNWQEYIQDNLPGDIGDYINNQYNTIKRQNREAKEGLKSLMSILYRDYATEDEDGGYFEDSTLDDIYQGMMAIVKHL